MELVFITNVPAPYKTPRFQALAERPDVNIRIIYANAATNRHEYDINGHNGLDYELYDSRRLPFLDGELMIDIWSIRRFTRMDADAIVVGGWNYVAVWVALIAGKLRDIPVLLISANTEQNTVISSLLVRTAGQLFDGYFALSTAAQANLVSLGVERPC